MVDSSALSAVCALVRQVGNYQLGHFRTLPSTYGDEKQPREYVSEIDLESEERLRSGLQKILPGAGFYGEESGCRGDEQLRWIVDPLDGTTNFLSGLDQFAISVALEKSGQIELGVVYRPASEESFTALRGCEFRHNERICTQVSGQFLRQALIGTGFPFRSADLARPFFTCAEDILYRCRGIRRCGSAALDLCYVAAGYLQGFWETDLEPYDVAAALLFMETTGCKITNQRGESYSPYRDRVMICAPPLIHRELLPLVSAHYPQDI
ncbi:MAG: inositol monophosphatase [Desulfuromonadales bacterium]|nr:inositol monophosphatase [Desulfuromonadales bacterium]MBN2793525.1 inositol monophosphatase [Desulfuromonadales bacterium]